jgi:uncharacterized membrane protein
MASACVKNRQIRGRHPFNWRPFPAFRAAWAHFVASRWPQAAAAGTVRPSPQRTTQPEPTMQLTPVIAIHMTAALGALVTGPIALWARRGAAQRPRLHRAFGYAWVTLMLATAISALFIRDFSLPNIAGYTPIHLLVPVTLFGLFGAFWFLAKKNIVGHRKTMQRLYFQACIGAGVFTLLPSRYLGQLVWGQWLGLT